MAQDSELNQGDLGFDVSLVATAIDTQNVPESFFRALSDFDARRVVDADQALEEPPPET